MIPPRIHLPHLRQFQWPKKLKAIIRVWWWPRIPGCCLARPPSSACVAPYNYGADSYDYTNFVLDSRRNLQRACGRDGDAVRHARHESSRI